MIKDKNILLIITGGIAAYKSLALIRLIKKAGGRVSCVLTKSGEQFVTPLSVAALSENPVYSDLFSLKDETEMGHIRLSRDNDLIIVAPATANIMAKMANGMADDLATTCLLASDKPVMVAPAMNPMMWDAPATQANIKILKERGVQILDPDSGEMACGETGDGRMMEPEDIFKSIEFFFQPKSLAGKTAIVTAGPTFEAIDPVRFIGNHSSGKQGYAIAQSLQRAGATVTLISGPCHLPTPAGVERINVQSAQQMLTASENALPADIAICTAAVCDWAPSEYRDSKMKKNGSNHPPMIDLCENPDILQTISQHNKRPRIVIGFAAETNDLDENAKVKLSKKGCDFIVANDVASDTVFGADTNHVHVFSKSGPSEEWHKTSKNKIADKITDLIHKELG